jgi:acetylglutamate kinase
VAGAIAEAVGAEKIVYLTDVEGLLRDVDEPTSLIGRTGSDELQALVDAGTLTGGMIPKIAACIHAVEHGVASAHIVDGRREHVMLLELFTDEGIGTMITKGGSA